MVGKIHSLWKVTSWRGLQSIFKQFKLSRLCEKQSKMSSSFFLFLLFVGPLVMAQSFTEDFESGIPNDWGLFNDGAAAIDWEHTTDGYQSNGAVLLDSKTDNIGGGNQASYYLVTPYMSLPDNAQIHFMSKYDAIGDSNTVFKVMISTAPQPDLQDFIMVDSWNASEVADYLTYGRRMVNLSSIGEGVEVYIAFVVENTQPNGNASGTAWFVDDLQVVSSCAPVSPEDVEFTNITTTSADVSWTHPTATYFDIQVVEHGEAIDENAGENINALNYSIDGLETETEYDVYIRTLCLGDIPSEWQLVGTFESSKLGMSCGEPIAIEGDSLYLTSNTNDFPNTNIETYPTHGVSCFSGAITDNYLGGNKIFFSYTPEEDGVINTSQMALPFSPGSGCYGNSLLAVLIYQDCDSVGVECLAASHTTTTNEIKEIKNFAVVAGETYIIVISTVLNGIEDSVCFDFTFEFSKCPSPDEITYTDLLQNSVSFSWNNPLDIASSWEYTVVPASEGTPTGSGTTTATNENNTVTGLDADTEYSFYVRSVCTGEPGEWGQAYSFRTQCDVADLPYFTGFIGANSNNPEPCWTVIDANNDGETWDFLPGWDVPNYASIYAEANQNFNYDFLVSPQLHFGNSTIPKKLRFKQQVSGWSDPNVSSYSILASTTGIGVENFTEVILPETVITHDFGWEEITYDIPDHIVGDVNIAWVISPVGSGQTSSRLSVTDVYVFEQCEVPTELAVEETSETSALLTWTPSSTDDTEWEVLIQPRGGETPSTQDSGTIVNTNNYLAEDLQDSARLEYYVRTSCSDTAKSDWVGPVEFNTLCAPLAEPYHETFNLEFEDFEYNDPETKRYCWEILDANNDANTWEYTDTHATINLNAGANDDWLISPAIDMDGDFHQMKFSHKGSGDVSYDLQLLISETNTDPDSFTELAVISDNNADDSYQEALEYFEATGTVYLAIRVSPEYQASANTSIQIDNFWVKVAASCPKPLDIERDVETNTITWTPGDSETQWEFVLLTADQNTPRNGVIVDEPSYTLEDDLAEGTEYKVFVRAICDANNSSDWTGPFNFITSCNQVFTTPFIETFEMDSESVNCWIANTWILDNALTPYEGQYAANAYTWGAEPDRWMISPTIEVEEGEMVSFYYRTSQYAPSFSEDLKVWLSTSGNAIEDFDVLLFENHDFINTEYIQASVALPAGVSGQINIAFEIPIETSNIDGLRQNVFVDNVEVKPIPACPAPYDIQITSLQDTQVELSWGNIGDVDEWEVLVLPFGTRDPFENIDSANIQTLTSNPGMVTGLQAATAYDMYIRPVCSDTNIGDWSELIPVVTLCSFEDQCIYTITLHSGDNVSNGVAGGIDIYQNGYFIQTLEFPLSDYDQVNMPEEHQIYFCDGAEFVLHWDSVGWGESQFPEAYVKVTDPNGEEVWMSELGIGVPRTDIYTGFASCSEITCAQPTDLVVNEFGEFSWTPGGDESQWEVYVQPYQLGALPNEGILVGETSYTPEEADLVNGAEGVYEYFVRAICSDSDKSYWSGPFAFILNDESVNALKAPVNDGLVCVSSLDNLSFMGSTPSNEPTSIDLVHNSGDIWVEFEATSETHSIEIGKFSGIHNDAGQPELPRIVMVLYKDNGDGDLEEIGWSDNNVLYTMYSSELVIGENYKVRLINTNEQVPNKYMFNICVTTIDPCTVDAPNHSFEKPGMVSSYTIDTMYYDNVIPGWRNNTPVLTGTVFFWGSENEFFPAYHGGQLVQLPFIADEGEPEPPTEGSSEVYGLYQDFDSSEITQYDYSFAHRRRFEPLADIPGTRIIQLFAGPVDGPYELIKEEATSIEFWHTAAGKYDVPEGQERTRFIFRTKNSFGMIMLDAANFVANNGILTTNHSLNCTSAESVLRAEGHGEWSASEDNPAEVILADATSNETTVSGFTAPGEYTFYWTTRYCMESVTITYEGVEETPEVDSPIEYCQGANTEPLTASELEGFDLLFHTEEVGGEGVSFITPDTSEPGTTTYYVSYVNQDSCEGARVPIDVVVYELIIPEVEFAYDFEVYCPSTDASQIEYAEDFTFGGVFTAVPSGLAIDVENGFIDLESSNPGVYEVTYAIEADEELCLVADSYRVEVEIIGAVEFIIVTYCDAGRFMLEPEFSSESDISNASFIWRDATGNTLGTSSNLDFANAMGNNVNLPVVISLTVEIDECEFTQEIELENAMCEIPKGISPNGDGLNDSFDLSGMSVKHITIFNRYGTKVYSKANYTDEWAGQSDKGKDLPDGTYYYVIETKAGESITGWVYLNHAY